MFSERCAKGLPCWAGGAILVLSMRAVPLTGGNQRQSELPMKMKTRHIILAAAAALTLWGLKAAILIYLVR